MRNISGNLTYDAARANWGGSWRLPTEAEWQELLDECNWTRTTNGGKDGFKVIGPNGNSIFLPAAGNYYGVSHNDVGKYSCSSYGYYWSSTPDGRDARRAYRLYFNDDGRDVSWSFRKYGHSVRPVTE